MRPGPYQSTYRPAYTPIDFANLMQSWNVPPQETAQQPAQKNPLTSAAKDIASDKLFDSLGGSSGASAGAYEMTGPASYAANMQTTMGPLADYGMASSSPASGAMAEMASSGAPIDTMGAAPGYAYALPAIATVLGARYGLRALQGKTKNWKDASLADNAGRGITAMATFGGSELYNKLFGGRKSTKEIQTGRWKDLVGQNITGADAFYKQLGTEPAGGPRYSKFQQTGNKADLTAEDVWGSPDVIRAAGNDYFGSWDEGKRRAFSQELLNQGLIDNRKGGIYATDDAKAAALAKQFNSTPTAAAKPQIDAGTLKRWRESRTMIPRTGR